MFVVTIECRGIRGYGCNKTGSPRGKVSSEEACLWSGYLGVESLTPRQEEALKIGNCSQLYHVHWTTSMVKHGFNLCGQTLLAARGLQEI